jgi:hypothetical protein
MLVQPRVSSFPHLAAFRAVVTKDRSRPVFVTGTKRLGRRLLLDSLKVATGAGGSPPGSGHGPMCASSAWALLSRCPFQEVMTWNCAMESTRNR